MPSIGLPDFSSVNIIELIGPAMTIALLGALESLLSAVVADGMTGTKHGSNQELIGQGSQTWQLLWRFRCNRSK